MPRCVKRWAAPRGRSSRTATTGATSPAARSRSTKRSCLRLNRDPRGAVDAVEQDVQVVRRSVFIKRLATALPVTVVIDDQHAAADESRVEMLHVVLRRL